MSAIPDGLGPAHDPERCPLCRAERGEVDE